MQATTLLVCLALAGSTSTVAAAHQADDTDARRFQAMDSNGDGVISRSEWRGSERSFELHDWNRDGVLSGDEISAGSRRRSRSSDHSSGDARDTVERTDAQFRELDRDGDGRLTRQEWPLEAAAFNRLDRNRDDVVSRAEFRDVGDDPARGEPFARLDTNADGRISRDEWRADPVEFGWWDRDRSGDLTRDEMAAAGRGQQTEAFRAGETRGLTDGRQAGHEDKRLRDRWDLDGQQELEQADAGYEPRVGPREDYQSGYRAGFRRGYAEGFGPRTPTQAYRAGETRGLSDGRQAGREDKRLRNRWDLEGQQELQQADAGYSPGVGARSEYQSGYRDGFRRGYAEGFGPR